MTICWCSRNTTATIFTCGLVFYCNVVNISATFGWSCWVRHNKELYSGHVLNISTMSTETNYAAPASAATPVQPGVLTQPHDAGNLCSTDHVDVDDWISKFEWFAAVYRWDLTMMLANVHFYLCRTADASFESHEADLTCWDYCKQKLRDLFAKAVGRWQLASKKLSSRA